MPVTPFHFGVGVLAKGVAPRALSVSAFLVSQVVIDLESAYFLFVAREWPVHRWAHTFAIGSVIGVATGVATWATLSRWHRARNTRFVTADGGLGQCLAGGLLGGASHPLLDGVMHADVMPFLPFASGNPFLGTLSLGSLHLVCVLAGVAGLVLLGLRRHRRQGRSQRIPPGRGIDLQGPSVPRRNSMNMLGQLNYFAIVAAAVAAFVIGGVWYSTALFGKAWQQETGLSDQQLAARNVGAVFGVSFVLTLVASLVFAMFLGPRPAFPFALFAGVSAGVAWVATSFGINYLFEAKSLRLFLINAGYHVAQFTAMGAILGLWH